MVNGSAPTKEWKSRVERERGRTLEPKSLLEILGDGVREEDAGAIQLAGIAESRGYGILEANKHNILIQLPSGETFNWNYDPRRSEVSGEAGVYLGVIGSLLIRPLEKKYGD